MPVPNRELAIHFVHENGSIVEKARLGVLLHEEAALWLDEAVHELQMTQREDGGWAPFWAPDASSVDATCYRLAQCEQLGLKSAPFIHKAISFLLNHQSAVGTFEEEPALADVTPPWAQPGELAATLYLTANAAWCIHRFGGANSQLTMSTDFLVSHLSRDGYLPTFLHGHWLAAGVLHALGEHGKAESILTYLHGELPELGASNLAWLVNTLCVSGVSPKQPLIRDAVAKLQSLQRHDGSWASEDGAWQDVHTTLEAVRAIGIFAGAETEHP